MLALKNALEMVQGMELASNNVIGLTAPCKKDIIDSSY